MMLFEDFILNESQIEVAKKIGDILSSLQELQADSESLSRRALERIVDKITFGGIKNVIQGKNSPENEKTYKVLQKIGIALQNWKNSTSEPIQPVISSAVKELEKVTKSMKLPLMDIGNRRDIKEPDDFSKEISL